MILELITSIIVAQASPPITFTDNKDGTVTIEGPADSEKRLDALYEALEVRYRQIFDNNTVIFTEFTKQKSLTDVTDEFKYDYTLLNARNTVIRDEIKFLQEEYDALFVKLNPEFKDLIKR